MVKCTKQTTPTQEGTQHLSITYHILITHLQYQMVLGLVAMQIKEEEIHQLYLPLPDIIPAQHTLHPLQEGIQLGIDL